MQISELYIEIFLAEGFPLSGEAAQVQVGGEWCCSLVGVASSGTVVAEDILGVVYSSRGVGAVRRSEGVGAVHPGLTIKKEEFAAGATCETT
jgi:hypothetical protein